MSTSTPSSKKTNGSNQSPSSNNLGSTPVSEKIKESMSSVVANTITAFSQKEIKEIPSDRSRSTDKKLFTLNEAISGREPVIVVSSEFVSIFGENGKTHQGQSLTLKETSKILNAKVAINILSQNADIKKNIIEDNETRIMNFIDDEKIFVDNLLNTVKTGRDTLRIGSYDFNTSSVEDGSLNEILKRLGYDESNISKFTQTKLWNQALLELKSALVAHTPNLLQNNFKRNGSNSNDKSEYVISDATGSEDRPSKFWWNTKAQVTSYQNLIDVLSNTTSRSAISNISNELVGTNTSSTLSAIRDIVSGGTVAGGSTTKSATNFVNWKNTRSAMSSRLPTSLQSLVNNLKIYDKNFIANIDAVNYDTSRKYTPKNIDNLRRGDQNILVLSNLVIKEMTYSSFFSKKDQASKDAISTIGYTSSDCNIPVWDYLIGTFPQKDVRNFSTVQNTLSGLSQRLETISNNDYKVLTFEETYWENTDMTPGVYYYIDSCLTSPDGKTFDTYRLDRLTSLLDDLKKKSDTIFSIMGKTVKSTGLEEVYESNSSQASYQELVNSLSIVSNLYSNIIFTARAWEKTKLEDRDLSYESAFRTLTPEQNINVRLASLLCKYASDRSDDDLIRQLFLWIMCEVISEDDALEASSATFLSSVSRETIKQRIKSTSSILKNSIHDFIKTNLPETQSGKSEIFEAINRRRIFIYSSKSGENSDLSIGSLGNLNFLEMKGLWLQISNIMKSVNQKFDLFNTTNQSTFYTGIPRVGFLYIYFLLLLKTIANLTPERILGRYSYDPSNFKDFNLNWSISSQKGIIISKLEDNYYSIKAVTVADLPEYAWNPLFNPVKSVVSSRLISSIASEELDIMRSISCFRKILFSIKNKIDVFKNQLKSNYEPHLEKVRSLMDADAGLGDDQKKAIFNLSFTEEQLLMSRYIMSELEDRIQNKLDAESKLKTHPYFSDFPKNFMDFMSINETDAISYTMLSPYFTSTQFLPSKGNNKKVIGIGIPAGLVRSLQSATSIFESDTQNQNLKNVTRVKVYKLDRLLPHVVYHPKSYLFELNRFPTRMISNWNFDAFIKNDTNLFNIPSKVYNNRSFDLNKDYSDAFPESIYGAPDAINCLKLNERYEIYINHSISFLSEEYLKWFTDCQFDETRYNNFYLSGKYLDNSVAQFDKFLKTIRENSATLNKPGSPSPSVSVIKGTVSDPLSGNEYIVPIKSTGKNTEISRPQDLATKKQVSIPIDDSIKRYLENETMMLDAEHYMRRAIYPKKFDRVFFVTVDPDEFYVDSSLTDDDVLKKLITEGIVIEETIAGVSKYRHRDTTPADLTLDEYFFTIEPYEHVETEPDRT